VTLIECVEGQCCDGTLYLHSLDRRFRLPDLPAEISRFLNHTTTYPPHARTPVLLTSIRSYSSQRPSSRDPIPRGISRRGITILCPRCVPHFHTRSQLQRPGTAGV
jgi:hypothetical protein